MCATVDILGEHTNSQDEAQKITESYSLIYRRIHELGLDCNISVKPTHIGQYFID